VTPSDRIRRTTIVVVIVVALAAPAVLDLPQLRLLSHALAFAAVVLGLSLVTGYSGVISLAHGSFMGLGAYTTAILVETYNLTYPTAIAAAFVLGSLVGTVVGLSALRLHGLAVAQVTLGIAVAFPILARRADSLTGGANGLRISYAIQPPSWTGLDESQAHIWRYLVILATLSFVLFIVAGVTHSRFGRALHAIRLHEGAARASGINVGAFKVGAFGAGAGIAALGGGLLMIDVRFVSPQSFEVFLSLSLIAALLIGGAGSIPGAVIGGLVLVYLPKFTADWAGPDATVFRPGFLFAAAMIATVLVAQGGLHRTYGRLRDRLIASVSALRRRSQSPRPELSNVHEETSHEPQETIR